jgi:hypothetical protein
MPQARAQDNNTFNFTLSPTNDLFGEPGQILGWGYSITNLDSVDWLSIDSVGTTTNFVTGTADSINFTPLIIGPQDTQESDFVPFTSGLYELAIGPGATPGTFDVGTFEVSATWYTDHPGGDTCLDFSCVDPDFSTQNSDQQPFSVTVTPEPETVTYLLLAAAWLGIGRRKRDYRCNLANGARRETGSPSAPAS